MEPCKIFLMTRRRGSGSRSHTLLRAIFERRYAFAIFRSWHCIYHPEWTRLSPHFTRITIHPRISQASGTPACSDIYPPSRSLVWTREIYRVKYGEYRPLRQYGKLYPPRESRRGSEAPLDCVTHGSGIPIFSDRFSPLHVLHITWFRLR